MNKKILLAFIYSTIILSTNDVIAMENNTSSKKMDIETFIQQTLKQAKENNNNTFVAAGTPIKLKKFAPTTINISSKKKSSFSQNNTLFQALSTEPLDESGIYPSHPWKAKL